MLMEGLAAATAGLNVGQSLANTKLSYMNYRNEKANQKYLRGIQQEEWNREDSAVQRRVADLQKAGLSPVLAAGSGASAGPVVQTQAPRMEKIDLGNIPADIMALLRGNQEIAQSQAQTDLIQLQKDKVKADTEGQKIDNAKNWRDFQIDKEAGMPSNATSFSKTLRDMASVFTKSRFKLDGGSTATKAYAEPKKAKQYYPPKG